MKWKVQLSGEDSYLKDLSKVYTCERLNITVEGDQFIMSSSEFNVLSEFKDVQEKASEKLLVINGTAVLALGMDNPLEISGIRKIKEDGTSVLSVFVSETIRATDSVAIGGEDGKLQVFHSYDPIPAWFAVAERSTNAAKVLRLFGSCNNDWVNLYRIYEVIENEVGGINIIVKKNWATKASIKLFKHTACSVSAVGDLARHGKELTTPPEKPMQLPEAKALIKTIFFNWIKNI